jgi:hypothetical protein
MKIERVFKAKDRNGADMEFELVPPNIAAENEGERQYRVAFSKALTEGIFPREKLRQVMRSHNMWTEDDESILKKTIGKIAILQMKLHEAETEGNDKKCHEIATELAKARQYMWQLFMVQQTVYLNSAEGVAEMIKTESIMAFCTQVKATGERYWKDYAEYIRERDFNTKSSVYANVTNIQSQLLDAVRNNLMQDYPEFKYMKSIEDRMVDREIEEEVLKILRERTEAALANASEKPVETPTDQSEGSH